MEADTGKNRCLVCGGTTAAGELSVLGQGGALLWRAARKIPRKHPLRFFKSEFFHLRQIKVRLMGFSLSVPDIPMSIPARYCPSCKKVFAWFDAPGVPPEVCDGEPANPEGGAGGTP